MSVTQESLPDPGDLLRHASVVGRDQSAGTNGYCEHAYGGWIYGVMTGVGGPTVTRLCSAVDLQAFVQAENPEEHWARDFLARCVVDHGCWGRELMRRRAIKVEVGRCFKRRSNGTLYRVTDLVSFVVEPSDVQAFVVYRAVDERQDATRYTTPLIFFLGCVDPVTPPENNGGVSRRNQLLAFTPAEWACWDAVEAIEAMPADVRLTQAVTLLGDARAKVADFVDQRES